MFIFNSVVAKCAAVFGLCAYLPSFLMPSRINGDYAQLTVNRYFPHGKQLYMKQANGKVNGKTEPNAFEMGKHAALAIWSFVPFVPFISFVLASLARGIFSQ